MEKVLHSVRIDGMVYLGASTSPWDPAVRVAVLDLILPTNELLVVDFREGVVSSTAPGLISPLAVLFFEADFCGVVVAAPVGIPSSSSTRSRKLSNFLYTAGLQGALPALTAGRRHWARSLLHAISQHAYARAISSSGFKCDARWRDRASSDSQSWMSGAGSFEACVGSCEERDCWIADEVGMGAVCNWYLKRVVVNRYSGAVYLIDGQ